MEGQKRPRVFLQKRYNTQKRFLALMLAFAMIFTSVGTDLNVAYAAEGNRVDFEIYGADLVEAINDAVETQSPVTADDLNFTNGAIEKFDALFFGEGKVYEVFPAVEGGDMDAEVRVFVRLPEKTPSAVPQRSFARWMGKKRSRAPSESQSRAMKTNSVKKRAISFQSRKKHCLLCLKQVLRKVSRRKPRPKH